MIDHDPDLLDSVLRYVTCYSNEQESLIYERYDHSPYLSTEEFKVYVDRLIVDGLVTETLFKGGRFLSAGQKAIVFLDQGGYRKTQQGIDQANERSTKMYELQLSDLGNRLSKWESQVQFWEESAKTAKTQRSTNRWLVGGVIFSVIASLLSILISLKVFG